MDNIWIIYGYGWRFESLWKIWKSVGMMKFPLYGNKKKGSKPPPSQWNIYRYHHAPSMVLPMKTSQWFSFCELSCFRDPVWKTFTNPVIRMVFHPLWKMITNIKDCYHYYHTIIKVNHGGLKQQSHGVSWDKVFANPMMPWSGERSSCNTMPWRATRRLRRIPRMNMDRFY